MLSGFILVCANIVRKDQSYDFTPTYFLLHSSLVVNATYQNGSQLITYHYRGCKWDHRHEHGYPIIPNH
jgi:hypothetical protein